MNFRHKFTDMNLSGYLPLPKSFATKAIHGVNDSEMWRSLSVTQRFTPADSKYANPSRDELEARLASLENAKYGLCFASGLGSMTALLAMFQCGDHIISHVDIYGESNRLFGKVGNHFGISCSFIDTTVISNIENEIKSNTRLIWLETPSNPTLKIMDIKAISSISRKHNIILAVDNTFLTSYFQRPLELGADLSYYSLTTYMTGHSDVAMGAIITNHKELNDELKCFQHAMDIQPGTIDCAIVNSSLKTLAIRMRQHNDNGYAVAKFLESNPHVVKVLHPGLPSHPQHELFKRQTSGHSGMVTFYLKGGIKQCKKFLSSLEVFTLMRGCGGAYESLAEVPSVMTHASLTEEGGRSALNFSENLVRLSIGLEDVEDLIGDLMQALNSAIVKNQTDYQLC